MLLKILGLLYLINFSFCAYNEKYRPQFHYSAPSGWLNDPNGLVYNDGTYHLFFQYWPDENQAGAKKDWGHAVSKDLFHWQTLPVAIEPTKDGVMIWSGSAIMDTRNVTGYQSKDNKHQTMVAMFTGFKDPGGLQNQWMAYSTDGGLKWKLYEKNPIIPNPHIRDFRDPKVLSFRDYYVIIVTAGNHVKLYRSNDLKNWALMSEFGQDQGFHGGTWECTDLFPMSVKLKNGTSVEKWILAVNTGPTTQYFVGSFDGQKFTNSNPKETVLWVEHGPDSYAGVTYNEAPNNRRIFISWMAGMAYVGNLPTSPWRGQMTIARDMKLVETSDKKLLLASEPVPEIKNLRTHSYSLLSLALNRNQSQSLNKLTQISSDLLDIDFKVDLTHFGHNDRVGLEFAGSKDKLRVYFKGDYVIDRTNAGRHDWNNRFSLVNTAPRKTKDTHMNMRVVLDKSSLELFADNGLTVMTSIFFSDDKLGSKVTLFYESSDKSPNQLKLADLNVHQLKGSMA